MRMFFVRKIKVSYFLSVLLVFVSFGYLHAQIPQVVSGIIKRFENFPSRYVPTRHIDVWLPEGYDPMKKYDVLYMNDGQMLFDSLMTWNKQEWKVDEIISRLLNQKSIRPVIVVGVPNAGAMRHSEYCPQKPLLRLPPAYKDSLVKNARRKDSSIIFNAPIHSDDYLSFLVTELKPYIDRTYSTYGDPAHTFIAGSSMGALISLYALCEYPDIFGGAACLSTHWTVLYTGQNNPIPSVILDYLDSKLPDPKKHKIYFDFGTATLDTLYESFQMQANRIMLKHRYGFKQWRTVKYPGADHSEKAWADRLHTPLKFLLSK